jgi:hypothetical protein
MILFILRYVGQSLYKSLQSKNAADHPKDAHGNLRQLAVDFVDAERRRVVIDSS